MNKPQIGKLQIREDFRRDGMAANFLVNGSMMKEVALAFPGSIINVGYPAVCSTEKEAVKEILNELKNTDIETAIYAHALKSHLDLNAEISQPYPNTSVCFWIPTSKKFLRNTLKKTADEAIRYVANLVLEFKKRFPNNIDVALADTTLPEEGFIKTVAQFAQHLHEAGARSVIICDSQGIGTPEYIEELFSEIRQKTKGELEFHPHNDNGRAISIFSRLAYSWSSAS